MPEGSECHVISDVINKGQNLIFEGSQIIENTNSKHRYSRKAPINWNVIANNRWKLINARCKGKLILIEIELIENKQKWVILATLGLSADFRWNSIQHKHCRLSFLQITGEDLSFIDIRNFGSIRIVTNENASKLESKIGHDLLQSPMSKQDWKELQSHPKIKDQEIKIALMEQKYFSGLGNIYAAESIYELGINPRKIIKDLDPIKWELLNNVSHNILQKAYSLNGSSVKDYTFDGKRGSAQTMLKIYSKKLCPLNHKVETIEQNKRTTWYCPQCQK